MKKTLKFALVMLAALFVLPLGTLTAGGPVVPKTLPSETYAAMKKGKSLDSVWYAPGTVTVGEFSLKRVDYKADEYRAALKDSLIKTLTSLGNEKAACELEVAVVEVVPYKESIFIGSWGRMVIEGRFVSEGKTLMAFKTSTNVDKPSNGSEYVNAVEIFASALMKELRASK